MTTIYGGCSCPYCGPGIFHAGVCPKVKSVEYFDNGTIKKIEFHDQNQQSVPSNPNACLRNIKLNVLDR